MTRACLAAAALLACSPALAAQRLQINAGATAVFGDYKETSAALHYQGGGAGFWIGLSRGRFAADAALASVSYQPVDDGFGFEDFKATQIDARARYYIASGISAEAGFTRRVMDPEFAAQSVEFWSRQAAEGRCTEPEWFFFPDGVNHLMVKGDRRVLEELLDGDEARRILARGSLLLRDWHHGLGDTGGAAKRYIDDWAAEAAALS